MRGLTCLGLCLAVLSQPCSALAEDKEQPKFDKKNRTETVLSYGEMVIADGPLPDAVFSQRRHTLQVVVYIHEKGKPNAVKAVATGSGYVHRPGLVVSSAHIVQVLMYQFIKSSEAQNQEVPPSPAQESQPKKSGDWKVLTNFDIAGEFHILGEDELRASKLSFTELKEKLGSLNCEYTVFVRVFGRNSGTQVPVTVAAITNPESEKDIMALRVNNYADLIQQAQLPVETFEAINPAAVLMKPAVTAEAELGETVYPTGFGGFQPFVEECYVSARPKNTNNYPYAGLKEPYTLRCSPDYGFSGGPVLNAKGQVIGISKSKTDNFLLVVSQKDIEDVLKAMDRIEKEAKDKAEKDKK